jgi:membrane protein
LQGRLQSREVNGPWAIGFQGWKDILWRVWSEFNRDRVMLIAAGATFYLLLAIFPALAVMVSAFGLVTDPHRIAGLVEMLRGVVPAAAIDILDSQLGSLASKNNVALSFGFAVGFLFALWSASNGIKTLFEAMNIAYEETEKRSFVRLNLLALLYTLGAMVFALLAILGVGIVPVVLGFVGYSGFAQTAVVWLRWPALFLVAAGSIALLYRYGPSRHPARWRWVLPASALVTVVWLVTAILFSWYLASFANYNATYGSLGAVIGFMMWTWVSMVVLIMGAELAAAAEHRTFATQGTDPEPARREGQSAVAAKKANASAMAFAAAIGVLAIGWLTGRLTRQ